MSEQGTAGEARRSAHAVGFVFARGGYKGLPDKNLREVRGRSLVAHAVFAAREALSLDRVVVSTDSPAIAEAARRCGAEVPFLRPAELAADDTPEWLAWRHALDTVEAEDGPPMDVFVSVPPTAPLRLPSDIDSCVARFLDGDFDAVVTVTPAARNPWFNMVVVDADGLARRVIDPDAAIDNRQAAPAVFDVTTVCYAVRPAFIREAEGLFEGRVGVVDVPAERALDIDTPFDLRVAEAVCGDIGR